jgi:hypothetical protein
MNHMTNSELLFSEVDTQIYDTVKFIDGSITKNREHRVLTGVYYTPCLKASIISIGQLDKIGCCININGGISTSPPYRRCWPRKWCQGGHYLMRWSRCVMAAWLRSNTAHRSW